MAHTIKNKKQLLARIKRIGGQVNAIERALEGEKNCSTILNTIAACRGAMNGLMAEIVEGHINMHLIRADKSPTKDQLQAAEDLIALVKSYLK